MSKKTDKPYIKNAPKDRVKGDEKLPKELEIIEQENADLHNTQNLAITNNVQFLLSGLEFITPMWVLNGNLSGITVTNHQRNDIRFGQATNFAGDTLDYAPITVSLATEETFANWIEMLQILLNYRNGIEDSFRSITLIIYDNLNKPVKRINYNNVLIESVSNLVFQNDSTLSFQKFDVGFIFDYMVIESV